MRYPKGSLDLSITHDYPLLRQIARSRFVPHGQLFEFSNAVACGCSRSSFNWRLRRLQEHNLVLRQTVAGVGGQYVYSITAIGAAYLAGKGDVYTPPRHDEHRKGMHLHMQHAIDLNDIQLALIRSGLLVKWVPENEIRFENELLPYAYTKYYDAVVTVCVESSNLTFGLEYERTPKLEKDYDAIAQKLLAERHISQFLYLTANEQLLRLVSWSFRRMDVCAYFGLVTEWHRRLLDMEAFSWKAMGYRRLATLLTEKPTQSRMGAQSAFQFGHLFNGD
jgi:hypothetical protein